jgi:hypothetical protein
MSLVQRDIDSYQIQYLSGKDSAGNDRPLANIHCFNGSSHEATIKFLDAKLLPPNYYDNNSNLIYIFFHLSLFYDIIDIFRHEKPLLINFDDSNLNAWISSKDFEPIGEQEKEVNK